MSLVDEVGYFLARTRMDEREFGRRAVDDAEQVENMRCGVPVTAGRALRLRQFIASYQPTDEAEHDAPAPAPVAAPSSPTEDREERLAPNAALSAAEQGCQLLQFKILKLYEAVARRDGLTVVEACILLNYGPERFQTWRARQ
jgi:hypothetical protein